jgi:hypothetical protein
MLAEMGNTLPWLDVASFPLATVFQAVASPPPPPPPGIGGGEEPRGPSRFMSLDAFSGGAGAPHAPAGTGAPGNSSPASTDSAGSGTALKGGGGGGGGAAPSFFASLVPTTAGALSAMPAAFGFGAAAGGGAPAQAARARDEAAARALPWLRQRARHYGDQGRVVNRDGSFWRCRDGPDLIA